LFQLRGTGAAKSPVSVNGQCNRVVTPRKTGQNRAFNSASLQTVMTLESAVHFFLVEDCLWFCRDMSIPTSRIAVTANAVIPLSSVPALCASIRRRKSSS
jgi:hypothetical protein